MTIVGHSQMLGPLMIDIAGTELSSLDRERLCHPLVGGLILFSRNYASPEQLRALCEEVHALRSPSLLIAVDHEGGRVQRFREGFTRIPPMRKLGEVYQEEAERGKAVAVAAGYVLAAELLACGVDFSFTPVLDLDYGNSSVIGDRSFGADPDQVIVLASALVEGLRLAGMKSCGKHFPGHGYVSADSHVDMPVDSRDLAAIARDIKPFTSVPVDAIMPAHVVFEKVDAQPAGFSRYWLGRLRNEFGFDGVVFSDDLSMEGAGVAGGIEARAAAAWAAGCDMLLVCNAPDSVATLLQGWRMEPDAARSQRVDRLKPSRVSLSADQDSPYRQLLSSCR